MLLQMDLPSGQNPDASYNCYRASIALASGHTVYGQFLTPLDFLNKHAKKIAKFNTVEPPIKDSLY